MITGGIDMGLEYIKAVVLKDGEIAGSASGWAGGAKRAQNARNVWKQAMDMAGVEAGEVKSIVATGKGKYDVPFASAVYTEPVCLQKAAGAFDPDASMVFSLGADECIVITLRDGKINELTTNQKCSAGLGIMLEVIAGRLGMSMEQLGSVDLSKAQDDVVSDGCMVFAEMDALSLLNRGRSAETIAAAAVKSAAVRAAVVFDDVTAPDTEKVMLAGGLAKAGSLVSETERLSGVKMNVTRFPDYYMAAGAAVMAAQL